MKVTGVYSNRGVYGNIGVCNNRGICGNRGVCGNRVVCSNRGVCGLQRCVQVAQYLTSYHHQQWFHSCITDVMNIIMFNYITVTEI